MTAAYRIASEAAVLALVNEWAGVVRRKQLSKPERLALRRLLSRGSLLRTARGRYSDPRGLA